MSMSKKIATAGAVAVVGLGLGAASASAYSITSSGTGGAYTSDVSGTHEFTVGGGAYTIGCSSAQFTGTATGGASTSFTPAYSGCTFFGFPAFVAQSGQWTITVTSDAAGTYYGDITIPASSTTTITVPIAGCTVTVTGHQVFENGNANGDIGEAVNWGSGGGTNTGIDLTAVANNIAYTASGCPFGSSSDGTYTTGGATRIPGVMVS